MSTVLGVLYKLSNGRLCQFQAKSEIRRILPVGLKESISKVRSSVAYAVSAIAHWDWPEAWPDLFPILMQALTSGDPNAVHGAMRVLAGNAIVLKNLWCLMPVSLNKTQF